MIKTRPLREWLWWAALLGAACWLAWVSFATAVAQSVGKAAPAVALTLRPSDSGALTRTAALLLAKPNGTAATMEKVRSQLRLALSREPLNAAALRLYAATYSSERMTAETRPFFALAERVTRRDWPTQLAFVMEEAAAGKEQQVIGRLDRTLRTSYSVRDRLFPILAVVVQRRSGREAMARYLRKDTPWLADFTTYAIVNGIDPTSIASWVVAMGGLPDGAAYRDTENRLVRALDESKQYASLAPLMPLVKAAPRGITQNFAITDANLSPDWTPLSWDLADDPGLIVSPVVNDEGDGQVFNLSVSGGITGPAARKVALLAPGKYRLIITQNVVDGLSGDAGALGLDWRLSCLDAADSAPLWAFQGGLGRIDRSFTIPVGCRVQVLELKVRATGEYANAQALIGPIAVQRLRP